MNAAMMEAWVTGTRTGTESVTRSMSGAWIWSRTGTGTGLTRCTRSDAGMSWTGTRTGDRAWTTCGATRSKVK